jgi:hypothetical protein
MENCMGKTSYEEQRTIALRTTQESVWCIYHQSKDQVSEEDSNTLHAQPIKEVMKWTKRHLDACLATAEVYLEQNIDPSEVHFILASQLAWLRSQGGVWWWNSAVKSTSLAILSPPLFPLHWFWFPW